ncbi:MAG: hypothetical protein M5U32_08350 [Myxococcota bacterium]|nr:hypothetical protein [Myxococcota bacterium]
MAKHPFLPQSLRRIVRVRPRLQRAIWALEAGLIAAIWMLLGALPVNVASRLGRRLLRVAGPRLRKSEHVRRNLEVAFPELSAAQRHALAREIWGHLGAVLAELPHLRSIAAAIEHHVEFDSRVHAVMEPGRPIVFVTAHVGSWDLAPLAAKEFGVPLTVIFTPESNPFLDRFIQRFREPLGCTLLDRNQSLRTLMRENSPPAAPSASSPITAWTTASRSRSSASRRPRRWCRPSWRCATTANWCRCASNGCATPSSGFRSASRSGRRTRRRRRASRRAR